MIVPGRAGAPARPPARAVEPAPAQSASPRAHRRPRLLLPALGVAPARAATRALCRHYRAMRHIGGTPPPTDFYFTY